MQFYGANYTNKRDILDNFRQSSLLSKLIIINVAIWLLINIIKVAYFLYRKDSSEIILWLAVPASMEALVQRPWTILTYMFVQENFLHLLFNMIMLYFAGRLFVDYINTRKLLVTYIMGGIAGAGFFILFYNFFPVFADNIHYSKAIGASASIMAILFAIAFYIPNYSVNLLFIGRIKMIYIALFFVILDIISIDNSNPGGHIAHLGGAIWGLIFVFFYKKGIDFTGFIDKFKGINLKKKKRPFNYTVYSRPLSDEEYNAIRADKQKKTDAILDKISKSGYQSLSKDEKDFLFKNSKQ